MTQTSSSVNTTKRYLFWNIIIFGLNLKYLKMWLKVFSETYVVLMNFDIQRTDRASWYILIIKANKMHYFSSLFGKELYTFRSDLLSIIRSLNTVFSAIGIRHTGYVDCLLARSGWNSWWCKVDLSETCRVPDQIKLTHSASCWLLLYGF